MLLNRNAVKTPHNGTVGAEKKYRCKMSYSCNERYKYNLKTHYLNIIFNQLPHFETVYRYVSTQGQKYGEVLIKFYFIYLLL